MSHYAKIENSIVVDIIVAEQDFIDTLEDKEKYIQTSYNTYGGKHYDENGIEDNKPHLRYNYAGIGYTYDEIRDAFIPPKPFGSWVLNERTCLWESPIPYPQDNNRYIWNEDILGWSLVE
jgi:hypothetical protein